MNNQNKNFKVFSGIRSFLKLENGYVSVTDVETKVSVVEDYKVVYDILKIILTEQRFNVFLRELSAGNLVVYNFWDGNFVDKIIDKIKKQNERIF